MTTLLLVLLALFVLGFLADAWSKASVRRAARALLADNDALFRGTHEWVGVDLGRYGWLDRTYYDRLRGELEAEGFRYVGDVENLTLSRQMPHLRSVVRGLTGDGGTIAGVYHVKVRGWQAPLQWLGLIPRSIRILDLESELDDGSWVVTTNTRGLDDTPNPLAIDAEQLPPGTSTTRMLARHRQRVQTALAAREGARVRPCQTVNEVLAAVDRLQLLKNEVMHGPEGVVASIRAQPGCEAAKELLVEEVRRA